MVFLHKLYKYNRNFRYIMESKNILQHIGFSLCALLSTSLPPQRAEAIIGTYCLRPQREKYSETYFVQGGENLWAIADVVYGFRTIHDPITDRIRHLPTEIARYNGIPAPYYIYQGQRLGIPHERTVMISSDICSAAGDETRGSDFHF